MVKPKAKDSEVHYWLFVDSKTRVVSRRLSQKEADEFIQNLNGINIDNWWAWNPNFRDWILLKNILDVRNGQVRMLIEIAHTSKSLHLEDDKTVAENTEKTQIPEEYSEVRTYLSETGVEGLKDFHGDDLTVSRVPRPPSLSFVSERRKSQRIAKKIEVLIAGAGKSFRTYTLNLSMTGVMLDKAIPPELQSGPFEVVFILVENGNRRQIAFQGKVTGDLRDRRRLVFGELTPLNRKTLTEIFAA